MRRHPGISPFMPVPRDERNRLMTVGNLALLELHGGQAGPALADLQAVIVVTGELLRHYEAEDGARACQEAALALAGVEAGTTTTAAAAAACVPLLEVFAALLTVATLRRLEAGKAVARAQAATTSPTRR